MRTTEPTRLLRDAAQSHRWRTARDVDALVIDMPETYSLGSAFLFVNLPEGECELTIESDRRPPHHPHHLVGLGRRDGLEPIVLEHER